MSGWVIVSSTELASLLFNIQQTSWNDCYQVELWWSPPDGVSPSNWSCNWSQAIQRSPVCDVPLVQVKYILSGGSCKMYPFDMIFSAATLLRGWNWEPTTSLACSRFIVQRRHKLQRRFGFERKHQRFGLLKEDIVMGQGKALLTLKINVLGTNCKFFYFMRHWEEYTNLMEASV